MFVFEDTDRYKRKRGKQRGMKYKIKNTETIIRDEKNGQYLLMGKNSKFNLALNETGKMIYTSLHSFSESEEIVELLSEKYKGECVDKIRNDVENILTVFEIYGIIELDEETKFVPKGKFDFYFNGDVYYKKVSKFVREQIGTGKLNICNRDEAYYSPLSMRIRVMQNAEYQVFAVADGEIAAYFAVSCNPIGVSKVLTINEMIFKEQILKNDIGECFEGFVNKTVSVFGKKLSLSKMRLSVYKNNLNDELWAFIESMKFKKAAELIDETIYGNVIFFERSF